MRRAYAGSGKEAVRAQHMLLLFETAVVVFFVVTTFAPKYAWIVAVDVVLGVLLIIDFIARGYVERDRIAFV
ncbi:MAG: ion transporter, partial [Gammaproteobacteria bacterium]|nr:ion transporter [Gammaproteobacteria bacterium]